jgi:hypothetical protein
MHRLDYFFEMYQCLSHGDRYLGMTAAMTQAPVPTATVSLAEFKFNY